MDYSIKDLLVRLEQLNSQNAERGEQKVLPPDQKFLKVRTLKAGVYRELSPYLKERFDFCSSWVNARLSQNWLSLKEIDNYDKNNTIKEWIAIRTDNSYDNDPPGNVALENCAIFSYNPYEPEETYLVWQNGEVEPLVWEYFGGDFLKFNNFKSYLEFIVGDKESDDSGRF